MNTKEYANKRIHDKAHEHPEPVTSPRDFIRRLGKGHWTANHHSAGSPACGAAEEDHDQEKVVFDFEDDAVTRAMSQVISGRDRP